MFFVELGGFQSSCLLGFSTDGGLYEVSFYWGLQVLFDKRDEPRLNKDLSSLKQINKLEHN